MEMRNNINFKGFDPKISKAAVKDLNSEVKVAMKKFNAAPTEGSLQELKATLGDIKNKNCQINTEVKESLPKEEKSGYIDWLGKKIKKITDNPRFDKYAKNMQTLPYLLVIGNTCKEAVGTAIYTVQALTNEDLPEDKRKFVGMYDLAVGAVSTSLSLVAGLLMLKVQTPLIKKLIGGNKELPNKAKAFAGMAFILPVALQTVLIKRVIAPAIATPLAGDLKKKMEAKQASKMDDKKESEPFIPPHNDIALSASSLGACNTSEDQDANIFDMYKKMEESTNSTEMHDTDK